MTTSLHLYAGTNTKRQLIGLPGHCDACATDGHVRTHPNLGCADVGCVREHTPSTELEADPDFATATELLARCEHRLLDRSAKTPDIIAAAQVHAILAFCRTITSIND